MNKSHSAHLIFLVSSSLVSVSVFTSATDLVFINLKQYRFCSCCKLWEVSGSKSIFVIYRRYRGFSSDRYRASNQVKACR